MNLRLRGRVKPYGPGACIELSEEQASQLSPAKQPPVTVTVKGAVVRVRISRRGGGPCVFLSKANRLALGVEVGDEVDCRIALDVTERVIDPPEPLAQALARDAELREGWDKLSFSCQREWAASIEQAKRDETKPRRLRHLREKVLG